MTIEQRSCHVCQSVHIVRNSRNAAGQQRYKCKNCGKTRVLDSVQKGRQIDLEQVARTYQERNSFRSTARIFKVSHVTVQKWLKKSSLLADFKTTIASAKTGSILEVDEIFSFIFLKIIKIGILIAQCRQTRQIISFFIGDGSMESCKRM